MTKSVLALYYEHYKVTQTRLLKHTTHSHNYRQSKPFNTTDNLADNKTDVFQKNLISDVIGITGAFIELFSGTAKIQHIERLQFKIEL